jgi:HSP20 family protein
LSGVKIQTIEKEAFDMSKNETKSKRREKNEEQNASGKRRQESERGETGEARTRLARREPYGPTAWVGSPFSFMRRFTEQMDRLFEDFGSGRSFAPSFGREFGRLADLEGSLWSPQVEVLERGNQLIVRADLPGLTKDDLDVDITDDSIVIRGERRQEREENEEGFYRSERSYGSFYREIPLPEGVNVSDANANFRNGVLEIAMPAPERQSRGRRRIEIGEGVEAEEEPRARAKAAGR